MPSKNQLELFHQVRNLEAKLHDSNQELETLLSIFESRCLEAGYDFAQFKDDIEILNDLGIFFLRRGMYTHAELLYSFMSDLILKEEKKRGRLHKGLPLHNIGVAQIQQGNFDEGIPNVLAAYEEDIVSKGIKAAEKELAYKLKEGFVGFVSIELDKTFMPSVKSYAMKQGFKNVTSSDLLNLLSEDRRLLLARLVNSKLRVKFRKDIYTRLVLLDNLKNLCFLLEVVLREKVRKGEQLPEFIKHAFKGLSWVGSFASEVAKPKVVKLTFFRNVNDFEMKFAKILTSTFSKSVEDDSIVKCFLISCLVRNFTAHEFANVSVLNDPVKYDLVLSNLVVSLLYTLNRYA